MTIVSCRTPGAEYVRSSELAERISGWLSRHALEGENHCTLARRAGVSPRAISKVLAGEREFQTLWLADRLMNAMNGHVAELEVVWHQARAPRRRSAPSHAAASERVGA